MMKNMNSRGAILAVVAVVVALVAAGAYLLWPSHGGHKVVAHFTNAVGLYAGDEVRVLGVPVGTIDSVEPQANSVKVSMTVKDQPGVLSSVAAEFGNREVSIAEVRQEGIVDDEGQPCGARIVVVTHRATDAALSDTVAALSDLDAVQQINSVLRLEGTSE